MKNYFGENRKLENELDCQIFTRFPSFSSRQFLRLPNEKTFVANFSQLKTKLKNFYIRLETLKLPLLINDNDLNCERKSWKIGRASARTFHS